MENCKTLPPLQLMDSMAPPGPSSAISFYPDPLFPGYVNLRNVRNSVVTKYSNPRKALFFFNHMRYGRGFRYTINIVICKTKLENNNFTRCKTKDK